jgi:hypothetical protein
MHFASSPHPCVPEVPGNGSMMTSLLPIGARVLLLQQDTQAGMIL